MAEMYLESRVREEQCFRKRYVPAWFRQDMSEAEYNRHTVATFIGDRDMYLDIPPADISRVLERIPDDF